MPKSSLQQERGDEDPVVDAPSVLQGGCGSHAPGHLMHYRHQARALRSPSVRVAAAEVEAARLLLELEDGRTLAWRHHDPARLRRVLELVPGSGVAYPDEHALRVGPYWFSCTEADGPWQDCTGDRR